MARIFVFSGLVVAVGVVVALPLSGRRMDAAFFVASVAVVWAVIRC
jgi:hypothetical protein